MSMKVLKQFRQGDVLIEQIDSLPKRPETQNRLLVRGEGRNHGHFAQGNGVKIYEAKPNETDEQGAIITHYLSVEEEAAIEHLLIDARVLTKEHDTIKIMPGTYRIIRQREYDPYEKTIRVLQD